MSEPILNLEETQAKRLQALELQLIDCTRHIRALEIQHNAMLNSHSWKLTAGLRYLAERYHKFYSSAPIQILRKFIPAAGMEFKRHGTRGVILRGNQYWKNREFYFRILASNTLSTKELVAIPLVKRPQRPNRLHPELISSKSKFKLNYKVSIVIPTLNAGLEFHVLLRKLRGQQLIGAIEIVVIDSGSTDNTVDIALTHDCKVVQIANAEFSHSGTRNLGASHATGDYLLFMVQDAYPIGDQWLYGVLSYLLDNSSKGVVAVSCAEYSRSDSDMMYDSMINTHYQFLSCLHEDRIGTYVSEDHLALRSQGQLSDVSCLISRSLFLEYKYRGSYAEDLDLGIRLIKDGHKIAMLASTKVIHSHNRPPYYYLKRTFVDVLFLVDIFKDFPVRPTLSLHGLLFGILSAAKTTSDWLISLKSELIPASELLIEFHSALNKHALLSLKTYEETLQLGLHIDGGNLDRLLTSTIAPYIKFSAFDATDLAKDEARFFIDSFSGRISHFVNFAAPVYSQSDDVVLLQLADVVRKTFGATVGAALSFAYLDTRLFPTEDRVWIADLQASLKAGV